MTEPRKDIILWLDLETSDSSDDSLVLEIGMALTGPGPKFESIESFLVVIDPEQELKMTESVTEMHHKNGLLADIPVIGVPATIAEERMKLWIDRMFGISKAHVVLAGSGVGHFDRKFIRRDWPWLDRRLAYYTYDVGVLRRFCRMVGIEAGIDQSLTPHRALDDVYQHIREARTLLKKIGDKT
jgi:oligoribonuclease (3'-5' exoribonuclease)